MFNEQFQSLQERDSLEDESLRNHEPPEPYPQHLQTTEDTKEDNYAFLYDEDYQTQLKASKDQALE